MADHRSRLETICMHIDCEILIADNQPLIRFGIRWLLLSVFIRKNLKYNIHEACDFQSTLSIAKQHPPDIAIIDSSFPDVKGANPIKALRALNQDMSILVLTIKEQKSRAEHAIRSGANGYIMKDAQPEELTRAIEYVCNGNTWVLEKMKDEICPKVAAQNKASRIDRKEIISSLSNRELEIFKLIGDGLKRSEIAQRTNISINTIETHRRNIKNKLGVNTSDEISRIAFLAVHNGHV